MGDGSIVDIADTLARMNGGLPEPRLVSYDVLRGDLWQTITYMEKVMRQQEEAANEEYDKWKDYFDDEFGGV